MALPQIIQGSLEEINSHSEELKGRNDLLLIIPAHPDAKSGSTAPGNLMEAMKDYIGASDYGDANLSENTSEKYSQLLADKYGREQS